MRDLQDGEIAEIKGSGAKPYVLRNTGVFGSAGRSASTPDHWNEPHD